MVEADELLSYDKERVTDSSRTAPRNSGNFSKVALVITFDN